MWRVAFYVFFGDISSVCVGVNMWIALSLSDHTACCDAFRSKKDNVKYSSKLAGQPYRKLNICHVAAWWV